MALEAVGGVLLEKEKVQMGPKSGQFVLAEPKSDQTRDAQDMRATPNYHDVADFEEAWTLEQAGSLSDKELAHRLVNELYKLLFECAGLDFY